MSRTPRPIYRELASLFQAYLNCANNDNVDSLTGMPWRMRHRESIDCIVHDFLPSGSGIDCGTKFDFDASNPDKLVLTFSYHHMNDGGMYDGWTEHTAIVRPSLVHEFIVNISGRDRNQIKDYLGDLYHEALRQEVYQDEEGDWRFASQGELTG